MVRGHLQPTLLLQGRGSKDSHPGDRPLSSSRDRPTGIGDQTQHGRSDMTAGTPIVSPHDKGCPPDSLGDSRAGIADATGTTSVSGQLQSLTGGSPMDKALGITMASGRSAVNCTGEHSPPSCPHAALAGRFLRRIKTLLHEIVEWSCAFCLITLAIPLRW